MFYYIGSWRKTPLLKVEPEFWKQRFYSSRVKVGKRRKKIHVVWLSGITTSEQATEQKRVTILFVYALRAKKKAYMTKKSV